MVIQAAVAGLGIALLPRLLIEEEVQKGLLTIPFPTRVAGPGAYYVVTPKARYELPRIRLFREWIIKEARQPML